MLSPDNDGTGQNGDGAIEHDPSVGNGDRAGGSRGKTKSSKFTMSCSPEFYQELQEYAAMRDLTMTQLVRHALTYERFLYDHRDWSLVMVKETPEGRREREIVLPEMTRTAARR